MFVGGAPGVDGYADTNGNETVPAWNCFPGCPVAELDRKSGECRSAYPGNPEGEAALRGKPYASLNYIYGKSNSRLTGSSYTDMGAASRYFKQIQAKK
jgi:hypothetical protein